MATLLYRLGRSAFRRWPLVLACWLVALIGVGGVAATMSQPMSDQFSIPGIPSEKATDLQRELFPGSGNAIDEASVSIVVAAPQGHKLAAGMEGGPGGGGGGGASVELIGIAVALGILAFTFGSLVAAGLPILSAGIGVGLGVTGITAMTAFTTLDSSTPLLATMIGLGVGIDYALFIIARYRSELEHTDDRAEAIGIAVGTAGSAVVFAGLTVVIALAALSLTGIPFLAAMGWGAAATVIIAVLVALTLLPAALGVFKSKAFAGRFRRYTPARDGSGTVVNNGVRWARLVGRAPILFALLVVAGLGAVAVPSTQLHLAFPSDSTAPADTTQRKAADLINGAFGEGRLAPMLTVIDGRDVPAADRPAAYQKVVQWAGEHKEVANAQLGGMNKDGTGALMLITPAHGPEDTATENLLDELRDDQPGIEKSTGTSIGITGLTAIQTDVSQRLADVLPVYLGVVIGLAFLILMLVFRSILVPLTATLGFLLSVMATLGATVAVVQKGMFGLFSAQPIISFIPIFLIGLVFGLAMDYQVFLVTRIREAHVHGASAREAVVDGFRNSARVVTAAALIMTAVFGGFILMDEPVIGSMGFALAVAVLFDAFVVRMCLIPALMYLMGERAWWLPRWLDRILPNIDVEGESLNRPHLADGQRADDDRLTESAAAGSE